MNCRKKTDLKYSIILAESEIHSLREALIDAIDLKEFGNFGLPRGGYKKVTQWKILISKLEELVETRVEL